MWKILLVGAVCASLAATSCGLELSQQSIEAGKKQYDILRQKAEIPNYGSCWTSALKSLHQDCKYLDDASQMRLALRFASCFLEASGLRPITCSVDSDVRRCVSTLSDRQFDSYREFFTHTHNMCSFLQVQVWHRETGRVVSRLGSEAAAVAERLEKSGSLQADILLAQQQALNNQQQALDNQQQLISHGRRLSHDVDRWRDSLYTMVQEFREQTDEHRDLILTVFERLTSLQQLVLDRFSWFNSLAHYLAGVLLVYLLTATARTASARPWLFLVLTCNLTMERLLAAYLLSPSPLQPRDAQETAAALERGVWLLRHAACALCLLLLAGAVYRYRDLNAANNRLLQELHKQHLELRRCLAASGMPLSGVSEPDWSTGSPLNPAGAALYQTPSPKTARGACKELHRPMSHVPAIGADMSLYGRNSGLAYGPGGDTVDVGSAVRNGVVSERETPLSRTSEEPVLAVVPLSRGGPRDSPTPPSGVSGGEVALSRHCSAPPPPREGSAVELVLCSRSPTPLRSRSGTPQPAAGSRYNLRARACPVSPESVSRRLGALARQHDTLVRRALHKS